jgi:predicted PurR-regulated permease PerM
VSCIHNRFLRFLIFCGVVGTTFYFLWLVRDVVLSFLFGGVLAYFLYRPVLWMERKGINRTWAILILYVVLIVSLGLILWFTIPNLIKELSSVAALLPQYAMKLENFMDHINGLQWPGKLDEIIQQNTGNFENHIYDNLQTCIAGMYGLAGKAFIIVFAPIMAFYILKDWDGIKIGLADLFPPVIRREWGSLARQIDRVIIEFSKGYLMIAAIIGVLIGIAAEIIGVKYALLIGIISGVGELIPYFGPILGGIPAIGLALSQSPYDAIYMAIAIVVIQQIESNIITPRLMGDRVGMHPLLMVFVLLAGGELMGIWGMLIAVPLAASLKIIGYYIYLKIIES